MKTSWVKQPKFRYTITQKQAKNAEETDPCLKDYLNQFKDNDKTHYEKSIGIVRFFNWLKTVKQIEVTPTEFLNLHAKKRASQNIDERRWALRLALEYSRENPDLKDKSKNYKYTAFFLPVKQFCDHHETPLTTTKGFFPKRDRRKYPEHPFTAEFIRRILGVLNEQHQAICLCELQAGQAIQQVLVDMNKEAKRVFQLIDQGAERIRFDFTERKGNGFKYFSYISRDAVQAIQKWRPRRDKILDDLGIKSNYVFITDKGEPYPCKYFHNNFRLTLIKHGFYTGPLSVRSHGFRKFFEQEASPPDRGISKAYVTFMMGHSEGKDSNGIKVTHSLDAVGGTYDNAPFVYPKVVEKEYIKLEPYINIYSGKTAGLMDLPPEDETLLRTFLDDLKRGNVKIVRVKK